MSLWSVYNEHQRVGTRASNDEVRSALTGNLCRCTGYRPILEAADKMFKLPPVSFNRDGLVSDLKQLSSEGNSEVEESQGINPQGTSSDSATSLSYEYNNEQFFAPKTLDELLQLKSQHPEATILAGGTDVGLWINKQFRELPTIIYLGEIAELKECHKTESALSIGAGATLTKAYKAISEFYPEMDQMWERFASQPIRNIGTLGGNVANGSPIGDSMPALIAIGAKVTVQSVRGAREMPLEDLYLDYMKKDLAVDEIVAAITVPLPDKSQQFRCYKLSKRHDSDISAVFAAFAITLDGDKVNHCKIAFGGMAATPKRASQSEHFIIGSAWNEGTVRQAMLLLTQDYKPLSDMRASDTNRMQAAMNLLYRFYLETRPVSPLSKEQVDVFSAVGGIV
jgi:xanthine dehydrogenase small subunit